MIVRVIRVHVKPESARAFEQATVENHRGSIAEPGVLRFDVLRSNDQPGEYVLYEAYADEQANAAHRETAHYKKWRDAVAPMMARDRESAAFSVVAPLDRAAW
jgi:(4S)-4-hydroxy-5-phosphonooxypentane-2,3-dione isomerase